MCGCCDGCGDKLCCCIPYHIRDDIKNCLICVLAILGILVVAGVIIVIIIFGGPLRKVQITVEDASLTRFALVKEPATTAIAYNLSLRLAVRNPNWAIAIKHDKPLEAGYSFDDQQFERVQVADKGEKQGARKTVVYRLDSGSVDGRAVALGNAGEAEFKKQNETGIFEVEVKVTGKFKYTLRKTKCKIEASCELKLQLGPPGTTAVVFQKVKCKLAKQENKYC